MDEALKVVKSQDKTIEEQEKEIKNLNSKIYDLKQKQKKSFPKKSDNPAENMDNQFQSGMVTGLKYALMSLEGHNIEEAYRLIISKYNDICIPKKEYWP